MKPETKMEKDLLNAVTALWHALGYFSAEEFDVKPDVFHDLVEKANALCRPYRKVSPTDCGKEGK